MSSQEATEDIKTLQTAILQHSCNAWKLSDEWTFLIGDENWYAVDLTCTLARADISCPCAPAIEYLPLVEENQLRRVNGIKDALPQQCPMDNDKDKHASEANMDITPCKNAHREENASLQKFGQLITAGYTLARKMYNCLCQGVTNYHPIARNLLTQEAMKQVKETSALIKSECDIMFEKNKTSAGIKETSFLEQSYQYYKKN